VAFFFRHADSFHGNNAKGLQAFTRTRRTRNSFRTSSAKAGRASAGEVSPARCRRNFDGRQRSGPAALVGSTRDHEALTDVELWGAVMTQDKPKPRSKRATRLRAPSIWLTAPNGRLSPSYTKIIFWAHGPRKPAKIRSAIAAKRLRRVDDSAIRFAPAASASARARQKFLQKHLKNSIFKNADSLAKRRAKRARP
jgi:hypothetical protein